MVSSPPRDLFEYAFQNGRSFGSGGLGNISSKKPYASKKSIRPTSIVKSIGFQFRSQRKHLAKFVLGFTDVCDSLHSGHTNRVTPSSLRFHGQPRRLNKWLKSILLRSSRNRSLRMTIRFVSWRFVSFPIINPPSSNGVLVLPDERSLRQSLPRVEIQHLASMPLPHC